MSTSPGLELVRQVGQSAANDALKGEVRIGRLEGSALSRLTLRDVEVKDLEGRPAVELARLTLEWRPAALLWGQIHVRALELEGPRVLAVTSTSGELNLARLVPASDAPPPEPDDGPPLPLDLPDLRIDSVSVSSAAFSLRDGDREVTRVDDLTIALAARAEGEQVSLQLERLDAKVLEGRALHVDATAGLSGTSARVDQLTVTLDGARVAVKDLQAGLPVGPIAGQVELRLPKELARGFGAPDALRADLELDLDVARAAEPLWTTRARGRLAGAPLTLSATVPEDLEGLQVDLRLEGIDPRAVHAEAPEGRLDVHLDAEANLSNLARPEVDAALDLAGRFTPPGASTVSVSPLAVRARLRGEGAAATVKGRVGGARVDADVKLAALLGQPRLEAGRLEVHVPELGAIVGAQAAGAVTVTATASGPLDRLNARGRVEARGLRWAKTARIQGLNARFDVTGLPGRPAGDAEVHVDRAVVDGRPVRSVDVALFARQDAGRTLVDARTLRVRTGDLTWSGAGAHVELDPKADLRIEGLGLASTAGRLRIDAELAVAGPPRARAALALERLDLAALPRALAPELGALEGVVEARLAASRSGHTVRADLEVTARDVRALAEHPTLDLGARVRLAPQRLTVSATVGAEGLGRVTVDALSVPPRRMADPAAWQRSLAKAPLRTARVDITELDLPALQALAGQELFEAGTLRGALEIDAAENRARLAVDVERARPVDVNVDSALAVRAGFDGGQAWTQGRLRGGPWGTGTFTATAAAPAQLFDVEAWGRMGPRSVRAAQLAIAGTELEVLDDIGVAEGVRGRLDADVVAAPGLESLQAKLQLRDAGHADVDATLDARTTLRVRDRLVHELEVDLDGRRIVSTRLQAPLKMSDLLEGKVPEPEAVSIDSHLDVDALPLTPFVALAHIDPSLVQGSLTASVTASGALTAPRGHARVFFEGLRLAKVDFEAVELAAELDGETIVARAHVEDGAGGSLDLDARTEDRLESVNARLAADGVDLSFLSKLGLLPVGLAARLFAQLEVEGPIARPRPSGWLEARELRVVFPSAALQPIRAGRARVDVAPTSAKLALSGESGGGHLEVSGSANLPEDRPLDFEATTKLTQFPVSAGSLVRIDLTAKAAGEVTPEKTHVRVDLEDGFVHVPDEETENLHPISEPEDVVYVDRLPGGTGGRRAQTSTAAAAGPPIVVEIRSKKPLDVRGGPVDAALATELDTVVRGGVARISGRAHVTEGAITLFRRRYVIERADLLFEGKHPPDPRVDVRLRHEFDQLSFEVRVRGKASDPEVEFFASPARYSQPELLTIFLGTDPKDLGQKDDRSVQQQALGAFAGFVVGRLQDQIGKNLPIDTLDVELGDTARGGAGTRVTLGKWITRKLFLAYRYKFQANTELENDNEAIVQYRFLPGWMVEVVLGLTRNDADIMWTKRF